MDKARTYKEQINNLIKSTSNQKVHARLQELVTQVSEWVKAIEEIAKRVDNLQQNEVLLLQDHLEALEEVKLDNV